MRIYLLALCASLLVVASACSSGSAPATPTVAFSTGYLWYASDPAAPVMIIGTEHDRFPVDVDELRGWAQRGEACVAQPGARAALDDPGPAIVYVTVEDGVCRGFKGWIPVEAWQSRKP